MQQIVDLENSSDWQALDVALVSIALDPADQQLNVKQQFGIQAPLAVDADKRVSETYDVMQWAVGTGEPGHTFILVDKAGKIRWIRDYGSPTLDQPTMYVETAELIQQVRASLP